MTIYKYFLRLYGLHPIISKTKKNTDSDGLEIKQVVVEIDNSGNVKENVVKNPKKWYEKKIVRHAINFGYRFIIALILLFECIHPIISSGLSNDVHYFTASAFSYLFLAQFIFGISLHNDGFHKMIVSKVDKYGLYIHIGYFLTLLISSILSTIPLFTTNYMITLNTLIDNSTVSQGFLTSYIIVNRFFSYNIFFANAIIFTLLMLTHCWDIKRYKRSLETMIDENLVDMNISNTIKEYTNIKGSYGESVNNANNMFSSIVVFGLIGIYFTLIHIKTSYNNVYCYIDSSFALLMLCMYLYIISLISKTVSDIKSLIDSPKFVSLFLNRSDFATVHGDVYNDYNPEKKNILEKSIKHSPLESPTPRSPCRKNTIIENIEQMDDSNDINKKVDFVKNLTFRTMVRSTENGISLDWIILYSKLSDPWEKFVVCGFEINDSQVFQQLLMMGVALLGVLNIWTLLQ